MRIAQLFAAALFASFTVAACSNDTPSDTAPHDAGPGGGAVSGPADTHCTVPTKRVVTVDPASCKAPADAGADAAPMTDAMAMDSTATDVMPMDDATSMDGMSMDMDGMSMGEFGATMYGAEGDDDDCKYHVKWSVTPTHVREDETFTLTLTTLADGKPATGAQPDVEVFLDETHPAPGAPPKANETAPGVYSIGPIQFDASGKWTIRFHFYATCDDSESSPHGHAAFYVQVP